MDPRTGLDENGEEKNLDLTGNRTPTPRSSSPYPVAVQTTLFRLLYNLSYNLIDITRQQNRTRQFFDAQVAHSQT
jgi:hypothetical protein